MSEHEPARTPEDLTRLFVDRSNAGDADGVAALRLAEAAGRSLAMGKPVSLADM